MVQGAAPRRSGGTELCAPGWQDGCVPVPLTASARRRVVELTLAWFADHARDLPWRRDQASSWSILVSEFMLQQTPVARVLPIWQQWLERWPSATDLARASGAEVLQAWGRLGYPRRAQRLHRAARAITDQHQGQVPADLTALRGLPGVGDYTAAAVASFAFGQRAVVLDTNVRRVLARVATGEAWPPTSPTRAERDLAAQFLPEDAGTAAAWAAASMELGALVCTARSPRCAQCPLNQMCRWNLTGRPAPQGPPRRGQAWEGTDRQCRGALVQTIRDAGSAVAEADLVHRLSQPTEQARRCLEALISEGILHRGPDGIWLGDGHP